jgi:hypothetical protein
MPQTLQITFSASAEATRNNGGTTRACLATAARPCCPESDDEYRHRMVMNAIALVFTSLLILAGLWLANNMMVHA